MPLTRVRKQRNGEESFVRSYSQEAGCDSAQKQEAPTRERTLLMLYCSVVSNSLCCVSRAPLPMCNEQGFRGSSLEPCGWGVLGRLNPAGYLTKSSNLWKATMAPIRWDLGEKPLSKKSSVLCLSSTGVVTLMGTVTLQWGWEVGG